MNNLIDAVEGFMVAQVGEVSRSTSRWYRRRLDDFGAFAGPVCLDEITPSLLRAYRAHLVDRGMSPHSVHGYQRATRRLFSWLLDEGVLDRNVARDVPLVKLPHQAPKALTDDDLDRLLARLPFEDVRDRAVILLLADTGCRVGGLCSLTLQAVDLDNRCATVVEKGQRGRRVYFTEMTAETLALYLAVRPAGESDALFLSKSGTALTTNGVRLMLERVGKRAGVKGRCNAHSFRHAFARSFLRNGGNLAALGRILGHTPGSTVTARYYAVWDDRELQEYHDRYSPLANQTQK
jgi:site-specific recombinase XerD